MKLSAPFRDATLSPTDFANVIARMSRIVDVIAGDHPEFSKSKWRLEANTPQDALLYPVFEGAEPATAAIAVLQEQFRKAPDQTYVAIWDGNETSDGINMVCHTGLPGDLNSYAIEVVGNDAIGDFSRMAAIVAQSAQEFDSVYIAVSPLEYSEKEVFDDRPGVGWMFYLPKAITARQVPEARALIPVFKSGGKKQTGTIIVSVTDAIFSADNPEHVELANRIEIRLVDQDLLPRYSDFR